MMGGKWRRVRINNSEKGGGRVDMEVCVCTERHECLQQDKVRDDMRFIHLWMLCVLLSSVVGHDGDVEMRHFFSKAFFNCASAILKHQTAYPSIR